MKPSAWLLVLVLSILLPARAETFRVATYNLESYLDSSTVSRRAKSPESRANVRESILAVRPDVLAVQEMGAPSALEELKESLKRQGLDLPYSEHVTGHDTNIHVAILSRFPFAARRSHTNENFLLGGRRFHVSRGFGEVDIQVNSHYSFTLVAAHLKSRRAFGAADESELRLEEAKLLRERIDVLLAAQPEINLVVLGDFNDHQDAVSTKAILGRGKRKLIDTRPAERESGAGPEAEPGAEDRAITWTHYYPKEDTYQRIDFILLSPGMAREWVTNETYVLRLREWGKASDHRPLVAAFEAEDR